MHNKVPCILMVRSSDRSEGGGGGARREGVRGSHQPAGQTGRCAGPTAPRLCGDIVGLPSTRGLNRWIWWGAPEGFLGREKSWCSWLADSTTERGWGACWKGGMAKCVCLLVGETVLSYFFPSFCLSRVRCWTADHDYKKAIMICLTERISETASNQQNEFQSKLREWHTTRYCNKRWNVNSPQSHYASIIHSFVVGNSNKTAITGGENMKALNWISIKRFTEV